MTPRIIHQLPSCGSCKSRSVEMHFEALFSSALSEETVGFFCQSSTTSMAKDYCLLFFVSLKRHFGALCSF